MKVKVELENSYLPDKYTKYSNQKLSGQPIVSFPMRLSDIPVNTKCLVISLIDYDAIPRTGFPFIHWLITDVPTMDIIPEDFSRCYDGPQGKNSWYSRFYDLNDEYVINHYAGPTPPDKPHRYTLEVFALNDKTKLNQGFFYNQLLDSIEDKIVAHCSIKLRARN
ncbi:YbhB/YbcL family Raf kinase inhibitor-like protein [Companilactobacillus jidongensis]|uniref:YbhB/YbcL family Raf kinase inhibitor-like protein n=1 Tax=Companilactobacillus jidongensis TaxID=2486006 RepID=UPI000F7756BD|nr:YbhB/YbcL family Raf kinase inhibitor-like protein [Companilactobacillus jidongensis]